jgi:hypothetical protein
MINESNHLLVTLQIWFLHLILLVKDQNSFHELMLASFKSELMISIVNKMKPYCHKWYILYIFWKGHLVIDLVKIACKLKRLPLSKDDMTIIMLVLISPKHLHVFLFISSPMFSPLLYKITNQHLYNVLMTSTRRMLYVLIGYITMYDIFIPWSI